MEDASTTAETPDTPGVGKDETQPMMMAIVVGLVTIVIIAMFWWNGGQKDNGTKKKEIKPSNKTTSATATKASSASSSKQNKKKSKTTAATPAPTQAPVSEETLKPAPEAPSSSGKNKKKKKKGETVAPAPTPTPQPPPAEEPKQIDEIRESAVSEPTVSKKKKKNKNKKNKVAPAPSPPPAAQTNNKESDVDEDNDSDDEMDQAVRLLSMKNKGKGKSNKAVAPSSNPATKSSTAAKQSKSSNVTTDQAPQQQPLPEVLLDIGSDPALLIGPGGSTIQRITATSGARLDILKNTPEFGQHRVRITPGNFSDGEDPNTSIAKAVEMVQALLNEQAAILANSKTVTIPASEINGQAGVKAIIGRSGQTIQSILQKCNESNGSGRPGQVVKINANVEAGTVDISGPKELVDKAIKLCKQAVFGETQDSLKLQSRSAMSIVFGGKDYKTIQQLQTATGAKLDMDKETLTLNISGKREQVDAARAAVTSLLQRCKGSTMEIKASDVGAVYGKGGTTIRNIQDKTGAFIEVQQHSSSDADATVKCIIMGEPDAVAQARQMITKALSREVELKPGQIAETLNMSGAATAAVIGRGGSKIKELESAHGVSLNVNGDSNVCQIIGKETNVKAAKAAIQTIIEPIRATEEAQKRATLAAENGDSAWQGFDLSPEEEGW